MIELILGLAVLGVILWFLETKIPMDDTIKTLIRVIVVIAVIVFLLRAFGVADFPIPRLR